MSDKKQCADGCPLDEAIGEAEWLERFHVETKRGLAIYRELERLTTQTRLLRSWLKDAATDASIRWDTVVHINIDLRHERTSNGQPGTVTLTLADLPLPMALVMKLVVQMTAYLTDTARQLAVGMDALEAVVSKLDPRIGRMTGPSN